MPGLSHEQYLDTPLPVINWMTRIHDLSEQAKSAKQKQG